MWQHIQNATEILSYILLRFVICIHATHWAHTPSALLQVHRLQSAATLIEIKRQLSMILSWSATFTKGWFKETKNIRVVSFVMPPDSAEIPKMLEYNFRLCVSTFIDALLQGYGYNLNWRGWGTSENRFTPNRPHWSLISTGEGILTGSRVLCFDPVKIPSPVEIRDQWDGLFGVKQYSDVPHHLQLRL